MIGKVWKILQRDKAIYDVWEKRNPGITQITYQLGSLKRGRTTTEITYANLKWEDKYRVTFRKWLNTYGSHGNRDYIFKYTLIVPWDRVARKRDWTLYDDMNYRITDARHQAVMVVTAQRQRKAIDESRIKGFVTRRISRRLLAEMYEAPKGWFYRKLLVATGRNSEDPRV